MRKVIVQPTKANLRTIGENLPIISATAIAISITPMRLETPCKLRIL